MLMLMLMLMRKAEAERGCPTSIRSTRTGLDLFELFDRSTGLDSLTAHCLSSPRRRRAVARGACLVAVTVSCGVVLSFLGVLLSVDNLPTPLLLSSLRVPVRYGTVRYTCTFESDDGDSSSSLRAVGLSCPEYGPVPCDV
jgi:hypothetical protein